MAAAKGVMELDGSSACRDKEDEKGIVGTKSTMSEAGKHRDECQ